MRAESDPALHRIRKAASRGAVALALLAPALAAHSQMLPAQAAAIRQACRADFLSSCADVPAGGSEAIACLHRNLDKLSPGCKQALAALTSASKIPPPKPAPSPVVTQAPAPTMTADAAAWPHTLSGPGGSAVVYQPQVVSWPGRHTLKTRIAIAVTPAETKTTSLGTVDVAFLTSTDLATRSVALTDGRLVAVHFPELSAEQQALVAAKVKSALDSLGPKLVPLDTLLISLRDRSERSADVALKNDPPAIFVSARAASLVVFDGEPVLAPIAGTRLAFAVNTNWDVFFDNDTHTWYLLNNGGWMSAPAAQGPWMPAGKLPADFASLPGDANFANVKSQVPGRQIAIKDAPTVFVSMQPAEIIVTGGPPQYKPLPGTRLQYLANSDVAVFRDPADGRIYFLVSGRWFAATSLDGPWQFATANLPADFARIPADGVRGFVLASVPGTPQAQEALIQAQIPQKATLSRASAKVDVVYGGTPAFAAIEGTTLFYATNTSFDVIRVGDLYYVCFQGAWFAARSPAGPWLLAADVPEVVYTIPPSSPLYRVTYVRVYDATTDTVTYGYTAGYTMAYVSAGVVVYGTGWYYPPYVYPAPIPIYYPYPYSYSGATYYNTATGAWVQGGAIYGPYGGAIKGGTAYNPNTGAWAQGGAIYGPNGGAGAFSAYNPTTGSYAHGSAVWGPDGASGNASWYNARTGRTGSTNQNSNAYGRWGSSTISGPNQTVHTQSQSDARGSAGSFSSTSGAQGAGVKGAGGNSAGVVKGAGGDVYAGADGNVYKKTDSGWQKYSGGGTWAPVQPSSRQGQGGQSQSLAGTAQRSVGAQSTQRAGDASGEGFSQLDTDRQARTMGAQRQQQFSGAGGGGGFAGRSGGGARASGAGFRR